MSTQKYHQISSLLFTRFCYFKSVGIFRLSLKLYFDIWYAVISHLFFPLLNLILSQRIDKTSISKNFWCLRLIKIFQLWKILELNSGHIHTRNAQIAEFYPNIGWQSRPLAFKWSIQVKNITLLYAFNEQTK